MHDDDANGPVVLKPHLVLHQGQAMTTSMAVAEHFGKLHKDVLKAIKNLECSNDFTERNFALCFKTNDLANGKRIPYYRMTRDGFVFLAMGFTGAKAAAWKEAYISAFNRMEQALLTRLREENARVEQAYLEGRDKYSGMIDTLLERVDELNDQVRTLWQDRKRLSADLEIIMSRITGPEELGVMMVLCGMRAPDAQLLAFLIRRVYASNPKRPNPLRASVGMFADAIGWESVQQVRDALKRLETKGLISIDHEKRGSAALYMVESNKIVTLLEAHRVGTHGRGNALALVPDSDSPVAELIRNIVGVPQGEHDTETEERMLERTFVPYLWKSYRVQ